MNREREGERERWIKFPLTKKNIQIENRTFYNIHFTTVCVYITIGQFLKT